MLRRRQSGPWSLAEGQIDAERAALSYNGFDRDFALVGLYDAVGEVEAKAAAGALVVALAEAMKNGL